MNRSPARRFGGGRGDFVCFAVSLFCFESIASTQTVQYELIEGSYLGYSYVDTDGSIKDSVADLRGTFSVTFIQREETIVGVTRQRIEGEIESVSFHSISGPEYSVSGQGYYSLISSRTSATGLPGNGGMELGLGINGTNVGFTTEATRFHTFPRIDAGLVQSDFPPHGYGVRIVAQPVGENAKRFFRRADVNGDNSRNLTDAILILRRLFQEGTPLGCDDAADANDDGRIDLTDSITVLRHLFDGSGRLPIPAVLCGLDPTEDALGCNGQPICMSG